ncbi:hypothetical protein CMU17_02410 [Elizabethkingia anophelis]|nr:hypothetical protein [Elizabethkingia anophelis]MDV3760287.1 hypothetical protein [Elizabethkingia anophelis]
MELPIYYSINDFKENYDQYLNLFYKEYPNAREIDFLGKYREQYIYWTKIKNKQRVFNDMIFIKEYNHSQYDGFYSEDMRITLDLFAHIIDCYFKHYMPFIGNPLSNFHSTSSTSKNIKTENHVEALFSIIEKQRRNPSDFITPQDYIETYQKYSLVRMYHLEYIYFLYYDEYSDTIKADNQLFEDFGFAVFNILDEIDKRINNFNNKKLSIQPDIENIEDDFSNNEDKVKLIILEKLGILKYIKSIQIKPEVTQHTAEILSAITGIKSSTLYTYLRPILNAYRDDTDKNSPYKNNENVISANKTIQKLKIKNIDADK